MVKKRILSLSPIERLMRKAGAERVSPEAVQYMAETLEEVAKELAQKAATVARHAKRKTITAEDIRLVTKNS